MPSSDSDDFESADEGHGSVDKKERKKRLSSSNYSDNTVESDQESKKSAGAIQKKIEEPKKKEEKQTDGWDDFDIDDNEAELKKDSQTNAANTAPSKKVENKPSDNQKANVIKKQSEAKNPIESTQDTGWDDFDDWGDDDTSKNDPSSKPQPTQQRQPEPDIKAVTDRLAEASNKSSGWGWGWGVDSLLSTATAGISTITNQVSQGISTVLETGIGAPDPEELARRAKDNESKPQPNRSEEPQKTENDPNAGDAFQLGSLLSGVTKFVESTGTKVIAGGLDTLETIGKKTMEVLQDGDPGLAKKRAMLGLDAGDKPVLSQVLREAKSRADEEDRVKEEKREAKEVHYENLFDDFEGLVHLEALEMLSRQVSMRIEERLRSAEPDKRQDIKETLQQVAELCEMPEEEDEEEESEDISKTEAFHERLLAATRDIGVKLQFQSLVKQYTEALDWLSADSATEKTVYKRAVSSLAQATALAVEVYHKTAEMLLVKPRRSTADESDALTQMTVVLTKHISELATLFTEKLNTLETENKDQVNIYITNIFLEAGNSSTYIQNAFQLALPILQIGAV
ncbi:hypothetical protein MSG28_009156 [Choristoneura fumiferana]|uniref:Uncharacterized protein n=1 Tax=Choristoneura fumiferana TaxID=7141 RepID=A0ACC0KX00_CHOFU|nr:hypothetical protein MSG28_009156 [Choristoneura fumiferana]